MTGPVIDVAGIVFDDEGWEEYLLGFARRAPHYLRVFERRFASMAGISAEEYRRVARRGPEALARHLAATGRLGTDPDDHVARLAEQGVRHQILLGAPAASPAGNDRLAAFAARHPDRLRAWAGLDLRHGAAAARELTRCVRELGMSGGTLVHFMDDADPLSAASRSVYETAARLGVPLWLHVGHNLSPVSAVDTCTWRHIDVIARTHPDLTIICGHGGWPWVLETVAVCQRHPNVYLEFSTYRARHMALPGSGWEPLFAYGRTTIRDKVLFGSVEWAHGRSVGELAEEVASLDLPSSTVRRWLHDNAAAALTVPAGHESPGALAGERRAV
ncbi:hypothetical protein HNP84_005822 [Thermocatellispora tengchongensis]|uniref:Amidohydrolase-related domain-containing protein n=1 Tax=Thermocatellispora tengchongensis TaxID=1073253 RepID=A0A840P8T3_9ACTN|nr:amidohydrolase family protein [Thermocatellispora tengchongensis]MBB5136078.1 hypothetical protein [Thermocatellispora tengchongensis]